MQRYVLCTVDSHCVMQSYGICTADRRWINILTACTLTSVTALREDSALGAEVQGCARDALVPRAGAGRGGAAHPGSTGNDHSTLAHVVSTRAL